MDKVQENEILTHKGAFAACCPVQALNTGRKMGQVGQSVVIFYEIMGNDS
jgi:hypothetical protein